MRKPQTESNALANHIIGFGRELTPLAAVAAILASCPAAILAQGTAFTYQGRLNDGGSPANGAYVMSFTLFNAPVNGSAIGGPITDFGVGVANGLFTVTLDFGSTPFAGDTNWLLIAVGTNVVNLSSLSPRQPLTPTPYAITAQSVLPGAGLAGVYSSALTLSNANDSFTGTFSGNGAGLTDVNAATLGGYAFCGLPCYWNLTGNSGTVPGLNFLGTTDNKALELKANNLRALRLEPDPVNGAPNIIGGSPGNFVTPGSVGAAIGGGGSASYIEVETAISGYFSADTNQISSDFGAIGGGALNGIQTNSSFSSIAGGAGNTIHGTNYLNVVSPSGSLFFRLNAS